jgi:chromosome segregation ATPase
MLSIYTIYKAKLNKAKQKVNALPRRTDPLECANKKDIEELNLKKIELKILKETKEEYAKEVEREIEELDKKIQEKKEKSEKLVKEIDELNSKEASKEKLEKEIKNKNEEIGKLNETYKELKGKVNTLNKEITDIESETEKLREEKQELEQLCNELKRTKDNYANESKELEDKIDKSNKELIRIKESFNDLLKDNVENIEKIKEHTKLSKAKDEQSSDVMREKIKKKKAKLEELNDEYNSLEKKYEKLSRSLETLKKTIEETKEASSTLNDRLAGKLAVFDNEIRSYRNSVIEHRRDYNRLTQDKDALYKELSKIERSINEKKDMLNPRIIFQYLPTEDTKMTSITKAGEYNPKLTQLLVDDIKKGNFNVSPELGKKMAVKYISFINMFTKKESFLETLEVFIKASYNDIYVENGNSIMSEGIFKSLETIVKNLNRKEQKERVKLCIKLNNEKDLKKEAENFNENQNLLTISFI